MENKFSPRRQFIRSSVFGFMGIGLVSEVFAGKSFAIYNGQASDTPLFYRYPSLNDEMVSSVVRAAHFDFNKVKELVTQRPELAITGWDWGFGDFETALGAASHMGRRDIAEFLMSYGARPDIFTFTMLGMVKVVKEIIETTPGIQTHRGPHGITLLEHAKNRLRDKNISEDDKKNINEMISYLKSLGNADIGTKSLELTEDDKKKFLGKYRFGQSDEEIFEIGPNAMNPEKFIQIERKGKDSVGRLLHKIEENTFSPTGAPSVKIVFNLKDDIPVSFTIYEPEPLVTAVKI